MKEKLYNINIASEKLLPPPQQIKSALPIPSQSREFVFSSRNNIKNIINRKDHRLILIVGPCSLHDLRAANEYAIKLRDLASECSDLFMIVMRAYFEKPRTSIGWKGFINDPKLDGSFCIDTGLSKAREFLLKLATLELPAATEALDPITFQYLDDLISWAAIGARTTESQTHRELASGLSAPVGFKNSTDGGILAAINAIKAASQPHHFLGINQQGQVTVLQTKGNQYGHIVLRGGDRPNYDSVSLAICERELTKADLINNVIIDCSHANCFKDHVLQPLVFDNCVNQIVEGNRSIIGLMLESFLYEGTQPSTVSLRDLKYGVSITDPCIDWDTTASTIRKAYKKLKDILPNRSIDQEQSAI